MDKKLLVICLLSIIIIGIAGVYGYNYLENKIYQQGVSDTVLVINQQIISNIIQNGGITVFVPINNSGTEEVYKVNLGIVNSTRIK